MNGYRLLPWDTMCLESRSELQIEEKRATWQIERTLNFLEGAQAPVIINVTQVMNTSVAPMRMRQVSHQLADLCYQILEKVCATCRKSYIVIQLSAIS